jgi:hypothetical protein
MICSRADGTSHILRSFHSHAVIDRSASAIGLSSGGSSTPLVRSTSVPTSALSAPPADYKLLETLGTRLIAYHFCSADDSVTCHVPEFVRNIAAQLMIALPRYSDYIKHTPALAALLSLDACHQNPVMTLCKAILRPLAALHAVKALPLTSDDYYVIAVDSLGDAEYHRADYGDTVISFLAKVIKVFPSWLKIVCTVRADQQVLVTDFKFPIINLDLVTSPYAEHVSSDVRCYIIYRTRTSDRLMNFVAMDSYDLSAFGKFVSRVEYLSAGSMLYCRLVLDLIERGQLVLKSTSYRILPVSLAEVFLLILNLQFPTVRSFERVRPIIDVCLVSLYPLTAQQLYDVTASGTPQIDEGCEKGSGLARKDFEQRLSQVSLIVLRKRQDGRYVFIHPALRNWFIDRRGGHNVKFQCDLQ